MNNMAKIRYLMVGECERCGREFVRPAPCDIAVCDCESAREIPLQPVLILPTRMYNKFRKVADRAGVSIDLLVNKVLELGVKKLEGMNVKEVMQIE